MSYNLQPRYCSKIASRNNISRSAKRFLNVLTLEEALEEALDEALEEAEAAALLAVIRVLAVAWVGCNHYQHNMTGLKRASHTVAKLVGTGVVASRVAKATVLVPPPFSIEAPPLDLAISNILQTDFAEFRVLTSNSKSRY